MGKVLTFPERAHSSPPPRRNRLVPLLGGASVVLGLPQVLAPDRFLEAIGIRPTSGSVEVARAIGVREFGAAGLIAGTRGSALSLWNRVAGDVMDLALLHRAYRDRGNDPDRILAATAGVVGITLLDVVAAVRQTRRRRERSTPMQARSTITINRPAGELYDLWRDFERLPEFMTHLESVRITGARTSHWTAYAPAGRTVEWDAEITEEQPGRALEWRSGDKADVRNSGRVEFTAAPGGRGTEVRVAVDYDIPGGALGSVVARIFGEEPKQQVHDDLRRFKQIAETGQVVRSEGSPEGTHAGRQLFQREAQPLP